MDILLIRHAETKPSTTSNFNKEKNRPDPDLSARGREQAERLARRLAGAGLQAVYASDLKRTLQTAEPLCRETGLPLLARQGLREIDMGELHFRTWAEIAEERPELVEVWHRHGQDLPYPGGENGSQAAARALKVLEEITGSGLDKAAVVTQGGIIRVLVCAALGLGQEKRFRIGPPENTSITTIKYLAEKKEFTIASLNDFSHLL